MSLTNESEVAAVLVTELEVAMALMTGLCKSWTLDWTGLWTGLWTQCILAFTGPAIINIALYLQVPVC